MSHVVLRNFQKETYPLDFFLNRPRFIFVKNNIILYKMGIFKFFVYL